MYRWYIQVNIYARTFQGESLLHKLPPRGGSLSDKTYPQIFRGYNLKSFKSSSICDDNKFPNARASALRLILSIFPSIPGPPPTACDMFIIISSAGQVLILLFSSLRHLMLTNANIKLNRNINQQS